MIDKIKIDANEINRILGLEEGPYLDLKDSAIAPAKLSKSVSAFSNTAGGELFVGVRESSENGIKTRTLSGFRDFEATNPISQVLESLYPAGGHYKATFYTIDPPNIIILHLLIFKTKDIVRATDGIPYIRRAAQNLPVKTLDGLKRLELDKGIVSFEDNTINTKIDGIANSLTIINFMLSTVPTAEPEGWLAKQNLIDDGKPTVAGLLLFSDEPQTALPKRSAIKIYRYQTREQEGTRDTLAFDPLTIEGSVYDQIKSAVAKSKEIIENISKLGESGLRKDIVSRRNITRNYNKRSIASRLQHCIGCTRQNIQ
jgi:ATP-dependent DNA helicase RecG